MNPMNLYALSQIKDFRIFSEYENLLSDRQEAKRIKSHEQLSLRSLVSALLSCQSSAEDFDGFYFSYTIQHISKEFDLLKIASDESKVLNIELKSIPVPEREIHKQLLQNRHYLSHISSNILSYAYIDAGNLLYTLDEEDRLILVPLMELATAMKEFGTPYTGSIHELFQAADYLISPVLTPDKFLRHHYFLTNQQEDFKEQIRKELLSKSGITISLSGNAGTGKTLLLYDIAQTLAKTAPVCMIHCGILLEGHIYLREQIPNLDIISIKDLNRETDLSSYHTIFIDEAQRIFSEQFSFLHAKMKEHGLRCVYCYDPKQILFHKKETPDMAEIILSSAHSSYKLSNRIRINRELASFFTSFFDLKRKVSFYRYPMVHLYYAQDYAQSLPLYDHYRYDQNAVFNFTAYPFSHTTYDMADGTDAILSIVGLEFDRVLLLIDSHFFYNDRGLLSDADHPEDYLKIQQLFQCLTRTRNQITILVIDNLDLFDHLLHIPLYT